MSTAATIQEQGSRNSLMIAFQVGTEEYGLEILRVREIIRVREVTRLPRAPSFVKGIINLRGDVVPVVELRERFGLPPRAASDSSRVIVAEVEGRLSGLVVDGMRQVVRVPVDCIVAAGEVIAGLTAPFVKAVGRLEDRLLILLDLDRLLSGEELSALRQLDPSDGDSRDPGV